MVTKSNPVNRTFASLVLIGLVVATFAVSFFVSRTIANKPIALDPAKASSSGAAVVNPPFPLPNFTLTSQTGDPMSLADFRGHSVLMFFGYTHCPDVCPTTLADYTRVKSMLKEYAGSVDFVFVSVDGGRDTPNVMADYLAQFDSSFVGLTGAEDAVRKIGVDYGLSFTADKVNVGNGHDDAPSDTLEYFVQHTSPSFLIDPNGLLRMVYFYGTQPETMVAGIEQILKGSA